MFNIGEFQSAIQDMGLMRDNKFVVQFPIPPKIVRAVPTDVNGSELSFLCKSAALPGIGILTQDIYRYGYGPIERRPYGTVVNDIMLQFYVDSSNIIRQWFRNWVRLIINADSSKGINSTWAQTGQSAYEFSYKQDYAVDIRITAFDPEGIPRISIVLIEAFPNFIGDVQQDWEQKNRNMIMPAAFTFRDWYEESLGGDGSLWPPVVSTQQQTALSQINSFVNNTAGILGRIF
jgi:hypothetical protein